MDYRAPITVRKVCPKMWETSGHWVSHNLQILEMYEHLSSVINQSYSFICRQLGAFMAAQPTGGPKVWPINQAPPATSDPTLAGQSFTYGTQEVTQLIRSTCLP